VRLGKGNDNLKIAVNHLRSELDSLNRDTSNAEKHREKEKILQHQYGDQKRQQEQEYDEKH